MLFSIHPATRHCGVFELLNNTFLYFLEQSINAIGTNESSSHFFPLGEEDACWENEPTRRKFDKVLETLPEDVDERRAFFDLINGCQDLPVLFGDENAPIPEIQDQDLRDAIEALTSHLFTRTKDLLKTREQSGDCIEQHYRDFCDRNGKVCPVCGTQLLSQDRSDIDELNQWRADYDHLLCKSEYAIYPVHPQNFLPTCHTCNSKAKGKRKLLTDASGTRRQAFYPYSPNEYCASAVRASVNFASIECYKQQDYKGGGIEAFHITFDGDDRFQQKINVWDEVYQVRSRVYSEMNTFVEVIYSDLLPTNFNDFCSKITHRVDHPPIDFKITPFRFWWFKLYQWLNHKVTV